MAEYEPVLLANIDRPDSHTLAAYEATGGYQAWRRVLAEQSPEDVQELVKASALRGRGGAGFPTGLKWSFLAKDRPGPIYFCLNADESEPGTFNNRILMELDPHQVLEGLLISCFATRASTAYFYLRYEYPLGLSARAGGGGRVLCGRLPRSAHSRFRLLRWTSSCTGGPARISAGKRPA